ncbi:MAG: glycosyltransferase family 2 protein [Propionibacteriaceae bacterium]|nr:glycosyltransferase family 2 protein [Propionibacteriaceae bacterium]
MVHMRYPGVSVVMPVRDEEQHLAASVAGVLDQAYEGELELILVVAPSQDRTRQVAERLAGEDRRIRLIDNPPGFTPHALNRGIEAAAHDIIVRVDAHGELCPGYITTAVELLEETGAANVGGRMDAQGRTAFEQTIAAAYNSRLGLGGGGFHLADTQAGPAQTVFLGVFRKDVLRAVGGFDEGMLRAQDWELNYRLRKAGHLVYYSPSLRVVYRPRSSVRALARQFFRTGQWRREVIRRHPETASFRYLAAPATVLGLAAGTSAGALGAVSGRRWLMLGLLAPVSYGAVIVGGSVIKTLPAKVRVRLPFVLAVMHLSWGLGFLVGLRDR